MSAARVAWLVVFVVTAARIAAADVSVSPGKLARPHARFENQCDRCHVAGGVPAARCLACHTRLADRVAAGVGFHATVTRRPCTECHLDHAGRGAALAPAPPASFDHRVAVFPLEGRHAQLPCARCHAANRWVGIATTCARCHADRAHKGTLGADCAKCHRADDWTPTRTAADHRLPLAGGHQALGCARCHRSGRNLVAQQACSQCHAQPHGGTRAPCETCHRVAAWKQVAYAHRFSWSRLPGPHETAPCLSCHPRFEFAATPFACAACHDARRPHPPFGPCEQCHMASTWRTKSFDHAAPEVGFPLDGKHAKIDCEACHPTKIVFGAPRRACTSCHADVHAPQFRGRACTDCHTTAGWTPSTIDAMRHASFAFVLRDAHARARCSTCHTRGVFVGTQAACASCHADTRHRGRFGSACERCHDATRWSNTTSFDHATTGFRLEGAHAAAACARCHGANGRALVGRTAPAACATCHATPHDRHFGSRCVACHTTRSWRVAARFDHDRTAFPLQLRHATLRCTACHGAQRRPAIQPACRSCHGDPHRGSNSFDCEDCHRPDRWRIIRFDHDLTAYPLTGRHRIASCGGCHTNPNWTGVRTDCAACHAFDRPRDDAHLSEIECEDCHTTTSWNRRRR